ncbi:uncharacterized protein [Engystomops pustulosus]|uniref:uncharacterized protein isoform X2 n=1 Tax=Engystomops pustulosus TaxID=76066 RepID=UPI003AFB1E65
MAGKRSRVVIFCLFAVFVDIVLSDETSASDEYDCQCWPSTSPAKGHLNGISRKKLLKAITGPRGNGEINIKQELEILRNMMAGSRKMQGRTFNAGEHNHLKVEPKELSPAPQDGEEESYPWNQETTTKKLLTAPQAHEEESYPRMQDTTTIKLLPTPTAEESHHQKHNTTTTKELLPAPKAEESHHQMHNTTTKETTTVHQDTVPAEKTTMEHRAAKTLVPVASQSNGSETSSMADITVQIIVFISFSVSILSMIIAVLILVAVFTLRKVQT